MILLPFGVSSSRQAVLPPYRHVALSTVGVDPRTPQNRSVAPGVNGILVARRARGSAEMDLMVATCAYMGANFSWYGPEKCKSITFPYTCA